VWIDNDTFVVTGASIFHRAVRGNMRAAFQTSPPCGFTNCLATRRPFIKDLKWERKPFALSRTTCYRTFRKSFLTSPWSKRHRRCHPPLHDPQWRNGNISYLVTTQPRRGTRDTNRGWDGIWT
jgi:hypothetical protein